MLLQFIVSNYLSFKNKTVLNLTADALKDHRDYLIKAGRETVLPAVAIFGANASGKTNIYKALASAIKLVRTSSQIQVNAPIPFISPFAFDKDTINAPSLFDFVFIQDGLKYQYGFEATSREIVSEYLYVFKTQKPSLVFERHGNSFVFDSTRRAKLNKIAELTTSNKLFLSNATSLNCQDTKPAFLWFAESAVVIDSKEMNERLFNSFDYDNPRLYAFMTTLLENADINISGYAFRTLPSGEKEIITHHKIHQGNNYRNCDLFFEEESLGTKKLFFLGPIIKDALDNGKTIVVDEIENSLHPLLVDYLVNLFNDLSINDKCAQLIFNTHNMTMLDLDKLRRDQIYFAEKNHETGVSELFSLDEFSVRKNEKVYKEYLIGRFGAIPNILK